jgi:ferric-dicitrate binding protein FerR (iron transport regulator)
MAYADGELTDEARREFEQSLQTDPELRLEVAELKRLEVLARQFAPKEPLDYEWEQVRAEAVHVAGTGAGWSLAIVGVMGGILWLLFEAARSDFALAFKLCLFSAVGGFFLLLAMTLRGRLRTLPHDPYRDLKR